MPLSKLDAHKKSIGHLQTLYATVVGLGLALVMAQVVEVNAGRAHVVTSALPTLVAFLATLLPFYHGAQRHLDDTYTSDISARSNWLLLGDFIVLFVESCLLFALAAFVRQPADFLVSLVILLAVDLVWGLSVTLAARSPSNGFKRGELRWAVVNAVAVVLLLVCYWGSHAGSHPSKSGWLRWLLLGAAVVRSSTDYYVSRNLYFGE